MLRANMRKIVCPVLVVLAGWLFADGVAHARDVTIYRGGEAARTGPAGPAAVLRGTGADAKGATADWRRETSATAVYMAGRVAWIVDAASDRITACRMQRTATVGRHVVQCSTAPLPN